MEVECEGASRGFLCPPDLPVWADPSDAPAGIPTDPLQGLAAGTYITRLFEPTVTFTLPKGWKTSGENAEGLGLSPIYLPGSSPRENWLDILNPAEVGMSALDWETLMSRLEAERRPYDPGEVGPPVLEPITEGGFTYPAGVVTEAEIGGFRGRSVEMLTPNPVLVLPEFHPGYRAQEGNWVRFTLIDVDGEPLLILISVRSPSGRVTEDYRLRNEFLPDAEAVLESLIITPDI